MRKCNMKKFFSLFPAKDLRQEPYNATNERNSLFFVADMKKYSYLCN